MALNTGYLEKQPSEKFNIAVDFAEERLASGESITGSPTVTATDLSDDSDVTSTVIDAGNVTQSAGIVTIPVKAGTSGKRYNIKVLVSTNASPTATHEADVLMCVKEAT